jgi:hypothetical protein
MNVSHLIAAYGYWAPCGRKARLDERKLKIAATCSTVTAAR